MLSSLDLPGIKECFFIWLVFFLNLIFIITLSAIKMWLHYSSHRPQSIHKIVPNRFVPTPFFGSRLRRQNFNRAK